MSHHNTSWGYSARYTAVGVGFTSTSHHKDGVRGGVGGLVAVVAPRGVLINYYHIRTGGIIAQHLAIDAQVGRFLPIRLAAIKRVFHHAPPGNDATRAWLGERPHWNLTLGGGVPEVLGGPDDGDVVRVFLCVPCQRHRVSINVLWTQPQRENDTRVGD